jgi:hypothetical protein
LGVQNTNRISLRSKEMIVTTFSALLSSLSESQDSQVKSWNWYMNEAKKTRSLAGAVSAGQISTATALKDPGIPKFNGRVLPKALTGDGSIIGKMILFEYDPKGKKTLPYWDQFPLGFVFDVKNDGYLMLNLHYLPLQLRARLMDSLYALVINKSKIDEKTQLRITYNTLQGCAKVYKPTIKRYLFNNVRSKWSVIEAKEWDAAMMLPLQRFHKASDTQVWGDSAKAAQKR